MTEGTEDVKWKREWWREKTEKEKKEKNKTESHRGGRERRKERNR